MRCGLSIVASAAFFLAPISGNTTSAAPQTQTVHKNLWPQAKRNNAKAVQTLVRARARDPLNPTYVACKIGVNDYGLYQACNGGTWDAAFPCGATPEAMAEAICNMRTPNGTISTPHDIVETADANGGECGIATFNITCHFPAGTQILYDTHRANAISVGCGANAGNLALAVCQNIKTPTNNYGVFTTWNQAGGSCGYTYVDAICYAIPSSPSSR